MKLIKSTKKDFSHIELNDEDRKKIDDMVKEQLPNHIRRVFRNPDRPQKTKCPNCGAIIEL
jgi:hypothetical protein